MITKNQKNDMLGRIGEKIVANFLTSQGKFVQESVDPFDSVKDLIVDGKTVEVKTQAPFVIENAISFRENQLKKCRNVDEFYVLVAPLHDRHFKYEGCILKIDPKTFKTRMRKTKDGRSMLLISIIQDAVSIVKKITDEEMNLLRKYTTSEY